MVWLSPKGANLGTALGKIHRGLRAADAVPLPPGWRKPAKPRAGARAQVARSAEWSKDRVRNGGVGEGRGA